jgi:hypothetical protein
MSKKINGNRFEELVKLADERNGRGGKRFYPISAKEGKILVYGMYDYKTKKYIISEPFVDVNLVFDEIEIMLKNA